MPRRSAVVTIAAFAVLGAGCASVPDGAVEAAAVPCPEGSDCYDAPRQPGEGGSFTIDAGDFFFTEPEGVYWSGDIAVTLVNVSGSEHNIEVVGGGNEGSDNPIAQALGGETADGVVNLFPGDYTYFCSIPGHRASGMEGTLTIYATEDEAQAALDEAGADTGTADQTQDDEADDVNDAEAPDDDTNEPEEPGEDAASEAASSEEPSEDGTEA